MRPRPTRITLQSPFVEKIIREISRSRRTDTWCDAAFERLDRSTKFTHEEKEAIRFHIHQQRGLNWFETL